MNLEQLLKKLRNETVNTWFDLGLFIDQLRDNRSNPSVEYKGDFARRGPDEESFQEHTKRGIAFITYHYAIDGVTMEISKYGAALLKIMPGAKLHFIAGKIYKEAEKYLGKGSKICEMPEIQGFDDWPLYRQFYFVKLKRGSKEYNELIRKFWSETLSIVENLGSYLEKNDIRLLYLVNINSNPGNVSLSLATVLLSEYLGIPVINNCHDYYWEGGSRKEDILYYGKEKGPRDFFFKNIHVGEFFSIIDMLFPWESRSWFALNINLNQTQHIIEVNGHNPANVGEVGTAVDIRKYRILSQRERFKALFQVETALKHYGKKLQVKTPGEILQTKIAHRDKLEPTVLGSRAIPDLQFVDNNMIFLQPTRVMLRKRIGVNLGLIRRLFKQDDFRAKFISDKSLKLTLLISGPVPAGQEKYLISLVKQFDKLIQQLEPEFKERVFMAFLFSEFDKDRFKNHFEKPVGIPELYNIASLVMLPSETEGRGLPLIEAAACGIPVFCRRYHPKNVYEEVVGNHLSEKHRLRVYDFDKEPLTADMIEGISKQILFPQKHNRLVEHNQNVIKLRFSMEALTTNFEQVLYRLFLQLKSNKSHEKEAAQILATHKKAQKKGLKLLGDLVNTNHRHFLPGFGRMRFILILKSLIDPSFFRVEEQYVRGMAMKFAVRLFDHVDKGKVLPLEVKHQFCNTVDSLFLHCEGSIETRHDHSLAYRHRSTRHYPYRDFTHQELSGLINRLFNKIYNPKKPELKLRSAHYLLDLQQAIYQLTGSSKLEIDDRDVLMKRIKENVPIAYFPGMHMEYELEFLVLQSIRLRLKLNKLEELTETILAENASILKPVYIFVRSKPLDGRVVASSLKKYLQQNKDEEIRLLMKYEICQVVPTEQWSVGMHPGELGSGAIEVLKKVRRENGFLISKSQNSVVMSDMLEIDQFHIGTADHITLSKMLGIKHGRGFVHYVPAGVRTILAYPTPIQTALDFSNALKGKQYRSLEKTMGADALKKVIKQDAVSCGSPLKKVLDDLQHSIKNKQRKTKKETEEPIITTYLTGVHKDGLPYSGVIASLKAATLNFNILTADKQPISVAEFVKAFNKDHTPHAKVAWNGGYILNPELVGKLGLPETYIGSPLGLIIRAGQMECPPLFNKPAFVVYKDGTVEIKRVNAKKGIILSAKGSTFEFKTEHYNVESDENELAYYDLMFKQKTISCNGRVLLRIAGNSIKEIRKTDKDEEVEIIPVGLTFCIPTHLFPPAWNQTGLRLEIRMAGFGEIEHAVEAGPLIIENSKQAIDMKTEGWTTENSIKTQAARMDYTDMRGPKIAAGIDETGDLHIVAINGRIRESVGATHLDMADILLKKGVVTGMGFDPGGSSTLVVDGKQLNISPYNKNYENDIYSMPPESRFVANCVVAQPRE